MLRSGRTVASANLLEEGLPFLEGTYLEAFLQGLAADLHKQVHLHGSTCLLPRTGNPIRAKGVCLQWGACAMPAHEKNPQNAAC